jgi:hypothetical protein
MRSKLFPLLVVCLVCLFSARAQTLVETETSVVLHEKTAEIFLVVENSNPAFDSRVELKLLDEKSAVRASAAQNLRIEPGKKSYAVALPLGDSLKSAAETVAWFRLQYQVGAARGVISLSEILRDAFELRVIAADSLLTGMNYRTRVRALNPSTQKAVAGVAVGAELILELKGDGEQKLKLAANGETDAEGFAVLDFAIPIEAALDDGEIKVTGRKNGIVREAEEELRTLTDDFQFPMLTDKPIYQPEQTLNARGILLKGGEGKTVVAAGELEFRIEDEDDTVLYREKIKTSSFGVAAISWKIPENAKLGNYSISVRNADDEQIGYQRVKISRYDLPNFTVAAKALKSFYLPGERQAEIEVSAEYLFGKPVTKGKVRVVRENSREWNWKEQKYDVDEGEAHEGAIDADGKFRAKFDLREAHEDLEDDDWQKFRDLRFTAYFTDLTTNRTEQRRFDVRVTREPIHVYFIGGRYDNNPALPVRAYVSTFYADGAPAACSVELKGREEDGDDEKYRTLQKTKTNAFGAGRLEFMRPKFETEEDDLEIEIIARDKNGLRGTFGGEDYDGYDDDIDFDDGDALQIEIEKTIFKPGESVEISLRATQKNAPVYIDVVKGWSVIDSYFVNLKNGTGKLKIPYQPNFQGALKIAAFVEDEEGDLIKTARGVIFPAPANLRLDARFDREIYKPGEEARVSFSVADAFGGAVESALGVVVFDRAIEERARTESEFNGMFANYSGWLGYGESFGGVNVKDLNDLDLSKPISPDLQLVGEVMLHDSYYSPNVFRSRHYDANAKSVYADYFEKQFAPLEKILRNHYAAKNYEHPTDEDSLRRILLENKVNFDDARDPWTRNYRAVFAVEKTRNVLRFVTAGADKTFDTRDDFTVSSLSFEYFTPTGNAIDRAFLNYRKRTGNFIRDEQTLLRELGVSELKDRFGRAIHINFHVQGKNFVASFRSKGKDGIFEEDYRRGDDFLLWSNQTNYFAETELKIKQILQAAQKTPRGEDELKSLLRANGLDFEKIRDGYGEKIYLVKKEFSRYANVLKTETVSEYGRETATKRTVLTPVTQGVISFQLRSKGADRKENTFDDFTLAEFLHVLYEQTKDAAAPSVKNVSFNADGTGSISGKITDANGAVVPGATVTATNETSQASRSATSGDDGDYLIANLAAGTYSVKVEFTGFKNAIVTSVPVTANSVARVDFALEAGTVSEAVTVTGSAATVETTQSSVSTVVEQKQISALPLNARNALQLAQLQPGVAENESAQNSPKSTPRLREYFPETLVWSPEIVTDASGRAELKFKMADNITTWKLYTVASTKNGKIGVAEKEVAAFQSFFVDLDPPKFLTDGDEIFLPAQVRNYTPEKQKVEAAMARADWFSFLAPDKQTIEVEKNSAANAVFGFKVTTPIKDGKQRVTAFAAKDSDAVEKPVTVRPNGHEVVRTETKLFADSAAFDVNFPSNVLPKTPRAELKIYPNPMAHVVEAVEGLLQRPYGCGEQTISSTYPNLLILKFGAAERKSSMPSALINKARKNLLKGYERLLGYQIADGGFSYWGGRDSSDVALTAYALRFLNDARGFIEVDAQVLENAGNYLLKQQRADGSFTKKYYGEAAEDAGRAKLFTSYVARTLAQIKARNDGKFSSENFETALQKALSYLKTRNAEIDDPYALALFGLALLDAGNADAARETVERLAKIAKAENSSVYWNLESNTPFYGWGTAGRIETTALVLQLLQKFRVQSSKLKDERGGEQASANEQLISKATIFLLKNKDRYGVWHSTQTTVNVLDAFLASLAESRNQTLEVFLNGAKLKDFAVADEQIEPFVLDLTERLGGANRLEIKGAGDAQVMAQIVQAHYVEWRDAEISNRNVNDSRAARLDYKCDRTTAQIMETVNCAVEAERVGFKGYGMLLAEIGLPPGADVSRESLEKAFEKDWSLSRYDVLPDRIVVYMWAKPGGSKFNFSFKPRYGVNAQTPASVVYDYYNEEAKAVVAPLKFTVK